MLSINQTSPDTEQTAARLPPLKKSIPLQRIHELKRFVSGTVRVSTIYGWLVFVLSLPGTVKGAPQRGEPPFFDTVATDTPCRKLIFKRLAALVSASAPGPRQICTTTDMSLAGSLSNTVLFVLSASSPPPNTAMTNASLPCGTMAAPDCNVAPFFASHSTVVSACFADLISNSRMNTCDSSAKRCCSVMLAFPTV